jgi:hypothetical protein
MTSQFRYAKLRRRAFGGAKRERLRFVSQELTSEFCGGSSPKNSGVSDFSVLPPTS